LFQNCFKLVSNLFQTCFNLFQLVSNLFQLVTTCFKLVSTCFKLVSNLVQLVSNLVQLVSNLFQLVSNLLQLVSTCSTLIRLIMVNEMKSSHKPKSASKKINLLICIVSFFRFQFVCFSTLKVIFCFSSSKYYPLSTRIRGNLTLFETT
jgi:hypothetical protein